MVFFFSSRRRHTRYWRDWSSDVCSSDLVLIEDLEEEKAYKLMEKIVDYPYLEVQAYSKRKYLYDSVAAHSIGYVKKISKKEYEALKEEGYTPRDVVGKEGLERQ